MSRETPQTISRLVSHIINQISEIQKAINDDSSSIFPSVRRRYKLIGDDYLLVLSRIRYLTEKVILSRAVSLKDDPLTGGPAMTLDGVVREWYQGHLRDLRLTSDEVAKEFLHGQLKTTMPDELYLWVSDFLDQQLPETTFVFKDDEDFKVYGLRKSLMDRLVPFKEMEKTALASGIPSFSKMEYAKNLKFTNGNVIACRSGESQNPAIWPVIMHELFHIVSTKKNYRKSFNEFARREFGDVPPLDKTKAIHANWLEEILVDHMAINYFGPVYAFSLCEFFSSFPHPATDQHPPMGFRLLSAKGCLERDIQRLGKNPVTPFLQRVENQLASEMPETKIAESINTITKLLDLWIADKAMPGYVEQRAAYRERPPSWISDQEAKLRDPDLDIDMLQFIGPRFEDNEIATHFFEDLVPIGIHPNILFNIIFREYERFEPQVHTDVLVESIAKWNIVNNWESALRAKVAD